MECVVDYSCFFCSHDDFCGVYIDKKIYTLFCLFFHISGHSIVMTSFDDLSIDLLQEIFHYLIFTDLFHAFFGLQRRLDNTIRDYPVCVNISRVISDPHLQELSFRSRSLILSGSDLHPFQIMHSHLKFKSLQGVVFIKMNLLTLHSFVGRLPMCQLESMIVGRFTWQYYPADLYKQVWPIIMNAVDGSRLRYLHLPYHARYWNIETLDGDFTALRRATLEYISVSQMLIFMSHTPNLRRFKACLASPHRDLFRYAISLSKTYSSHFDSAR